MKWDDAFAGGHECYRWYDLLAGEGTENDALLGYVRENLVDKTFIACVNDMRSDTKKFSNLEAAKAHVVTYYVTQKLEGT